jgi:multidrug efflux pump subunit AcrA (membrane-fusion protein)
MRTALFVFAAVTTVGLAAARRTAGAEPLKDPTLTGCVVAAANEATVSAEDPGVLVSVNVIEGDAVAKGYPLARIDDAEARKRKEVAKLEWDAAVEQANNDINIRFSEAQEKHAEATLAEKIAANKRQRGTITEEVLRTHRLDWERTKLSIEQAKFEKGVAAITAEAKKASVDMEADNIQRRLITAPINGEVATLAKHTGEWVSPGDPILRIIDMETLRIEGFLNAAQYDPGDVSGRPVTVEVKLARDRQVKFNGRVTFVSSEIQTGGEYPVWAEVKNRKEGSYWVLHPGRIASMTIHVNRAIDGGRLPAASKGKSRTPVTTSKSSRVRASGR